MFEPQSSVVKVGEKAPKEYLRAVSYLLRHGASQVSIVGRGRNVSRTIEVALMAVKHFNLGILNDGVQFGPVTNPNNGQTIPSIEIVLTSSKTTPRFSYVPYGVSL